MMELFLRLELVLYGEMKLRNGVNKKYFLYVWKKDQYRSVHYISAVCSMFYIAEAMKLAMTEGELSGESIRNAM